jgi:hypothetical protein
VDSRDLAAVFPGATVRVKWEPEGQGLEVIHLGVPKTMVEQTVNVAASRVGMLDRVVLYGSELGGDDQKPRVGTGVVLLAGATSAALWRPDLDLTQLVGRWGVWDGRWLVFVCDPRSRMAKTQIARWLEGVDRGLLNIGGGCVRCEVRASEFDFDGLPWCRRHWDELTLGGGPRVPLLSKEDRKRKLGRKPGKRKK